MSDADRIRWARVKRVLGDALELPLEDRAAFLEDACSGDADLLAEVNGLLDRARAGGRLDQATESLREMVREGSALEPGDRVGRFRIEREIGRGGMGAVYLAQREGADFEQWVAIKFVAHGVATTELSRRLREERRILARLDHPGIARFLDGDIAPDGRPYLVMEYVDGVPIDIFADEHRLGLDDRIDLFLSVLEAVQCAHQHRVVHQDIKPSNILVRRDRTVKLLDFGVAGLLGEERRQVGGGRGGHTPGYASPEQTRGEPGTLASDVYSLGVLMNVLLTGARPSSGRTLPSQSDILPLAADRRDATVPALRSRLRGDLDAIVLRALEESPSERYSTVEQLQRDLLAMRGGHPVAARPDIWSYRASKFVHRNRVGVAAAAVVLLVLVSGLMATVTQARRAQEQARLVAEERDLTQQVSELLVGMFELSDPEAGLGETVGAREILDRALVDVDRTLAGQPEAQARLLYEIGRVYHNLGLFGRATPVAERALRLSRRDGEVSADLGRSLALVADLTAHAGDTDRAIELWEEAVSAQRARSPVDPTEIASTLLRLAQLRLDLGQADAAGPELDEALGLLDGRGPEDRDLRLEVLYGLASASHQDMDFALVEERLREAVALTPLSEGADFGRVGAVAALVRHDLGQIMMARGRHTEAQALLGEALAIQDRVLPESHANRVATLVALSGLLVNSGQHAEAADMLENVLALQQATGDADPLQVSGTRFMLGSAFAAIGRGPEAVELLATALAEYEKGYGPDHPFLVTLAHMLSSTRLAEGDLAGAEEAASIARAAVRSNYDDDHMFAVRSRALDGRLAAASGESDEALMILRDAVARGLRAGGQNHRITIGAQLALGQLLLADGDVAEAAPLLRTVFEAARSLEEDSSPLLSAAEHWHGQALAADGEHDEARIRLTEALRKREATLPPGHRLVRETRVAIERLPSG